MEDDRTISTVLFDLDGTILDTRTNIVAALCSAVKTELGIEITPDRDHMGDMLRRRPMEYFRQHYGDHAFGLYERYRSEYSSVGIVPFAGVIDEIMKLKHRGFKVGIVTNKALERVMQDLVEVKIDRSVFDVVVTAEDTLERKPDPAPIYFAANALGVTADELIYVGDGPHDVVAATNAGAYSVAVTWGYYTEDALRDCSPSYLAVDAHTFDSYFDTLAGPCENAGVDP